MMQRTPLRRIPHKRGGRGTNKLFSVRLDPDTFRRLRVISRRDRRTMASLVAPLIADFAAREAGEFDQLAS